MTTFIMMCGIVGSGKSDKAKELAKQYDANIHASDSIREELTGDINNQDINELVFKTLHGRIKEDLCNCKNCIYDATNISKKFRRQFLSELKNISCTPVCLCMAISYETCLINNENRERKVPEEVIYRMRMNWQPLIIVRVLKKLNMYFLLVTMDLLIHLISANLLKRLMNLTKKINITC
jgi:predicted kinase